MPLRKILVYAYLTFFQAMNQNVIFKYISRSCDAIGRFHDRITPYIIKTISIGLFVFVFSTIIYLTMTQALISIPYLYTSLFSKTLMWSSLILVVANILYNYMVICWTNPESPPDYEHALKAGATQQDRKCKKCLRLKPERCHHCSICNKCILKMDHHCIWTNGCVGETNYRFFILFVFWTLIGSIFSIFNSFEYLKKIFNVCDLNKDVKFTRCIVELRFLWTISSFLLSCFSTLFTLLLIMFHCYLITTNQSTIEFYQGKKTHYNTKGDDKSLLLIKRYPYSQGFKKNFKSVFGNSPFPLCLFSMFSANPTRLPLFKSILDHRETKTQLTEVPLTY